MNSPSLGEEMVETKRENTFDPILCCIHISIIYTHKLFSLNTSCVAFDESIWCILEITSSAYQNHLCIWFQKNAIIFLHCVLMLNIIVDMSSILSFAHINWNENLKFDKMDYVMSFFIHSNVFAPFRNFDSKTKDLLKSTSTWVVSKCIYNNSMSILVTYTQ